MATETRLNELLSRWEERKRLGEFVPAEEMCRDCPELLDEFRRHITVDASQPQPSDTQVRETLAYARSGATPLGGGEPPATSAVASGLLDSMLRAEMEPVPGYKLDKPLGRGGFGEVWRAVGPGGFAVAMKFIRLGADAEAIEMRSLELMKEIRHANFLAMFGCWKLEGFLIVAMELADKTLYDRFREAVSEGLPGVPRDELVEYMYEAAKGLDFLNEPRHVFKDKEGGIGVQHRDIKPQNLLLVGSSIKIADFGLAKVLEGATTRNTGNLTPAYAAPEFLQGHTSAFSDQYSLAVTYCHLRGGRLPFAGTCVQVIEGHVLNSPDLTMLPPEERPAVDRALAKKPEDRWPNCRAFIRTLMEATQPFAPPSQPQDEWALRRSPGDSSDAVAPMNLASSPPTELEPLPTGTAAETPSAEEILIAPAVPICVGEFCYLPHPAGLVGAAFVDQRIISLDGQGRARLWDRVDGREVATWETGLASPRALAVSADGRRAAIAGYTQRAVQIWDLAETRLLRRLGDHRWPISSIDLSSHGRWLLTATEDGTLRLWDIDSGEKLRRFRGHTNVVRSAVISPRRHRIVSAGGSLRYRNGLLQLADVTIRLWDIKSHQELRCFEGHGSWINAVAFSPDGRFIASAGADKIVRIWDVTTGDEVQSLRGHAAPVTCIAFSPDGQRLLSGAGDYDRIITGVIPHDCTVRLWSFDTGAELHAFTGHTGVIRAVAFAPDGKHALSAGDDATLRLWGLPQSAA